MGRWTTRRGDGETVCAVCGEEKWKRDAEERTECCRTAPPVPRERFLLEYFGADAHTDPSGPAHSYVPLDTLQEFHEDYLLSAHESLESYREATTVKELS